MGYGKHQDFIFCSWEIGDQTSPMSKPGVHFIVTANFTDDGAVAYRRADGSWGRKLGEAGTFPTEADAQPFVDAAAEKEQRLVADPYAIDVSVGDKGIEALTARERIRANGPTIPMRRPDTGVSRKPA